MFKTFIFFMNTRSLLSVFLVLFILAAPVARAADVFTDVTSAHPHYQAIITLHERGVIEGYTNNTFRPDQPVNRAEALKIILLGSGIFSPDIQEDFSVFPDVVPGVWYAKYVAKAKNLKIVAGDATTGLFRPGDTINLAEILKILIEANGVETRPPSAHPYADVPPDAWFARYFDYARLMGLLDSSPKDDVHPDTPMDRGMMAELLYRLSQKPKADGYGKASFYGDTFHGRTTASGDVFDASGLTAAHRSYPFGTWLKVTNLENSKSVTVRVNDRGPYAGDDRIIDLSKAAFESISALSRGVITVAIEKTGEPTPSVTPTGGTAAPGNPPASAPTPENLPETPAPTSPDNALSVDVSAAPSEIPASPCPRKEDIKTLPPRLFSSIFLTEEVSDTAIEGQTLTLHGRTTSTSPQVTAFLVNSANVQIPFSAPVTDGLFSVTLRLNEKGSFRLGLVPGTQGESVVTPFTVLPISCLQESVNDTAAAPANLTFKMNRGDSVLYWEKGSYNLFQLSLSQEGQFKRFLLRDADQWTPAYADFKDFKEGSVDIQLRGATVVGASLLSVAPLVWSAPAVLSVSAVTHQPYVLESSQIDPSLLPTTAQRGRPIQLRLTAKVPMRSEGSVILPSGGVENVTLTSETSAAAKDKNGVSVFPPSDSILQFSFTPTATGLHFVEVNNAEGLAAVNIPVYAAGVFPLLPNPLEAAPRQTVDLGSDLPALRTQFLTLINRDRTAYQKSTVVLDDTLSQLAQLRADDMAARDYFGHWNAEGLGVNDLRAQFAVSQTVAENLAKETDIPFAHYGLMQSAIHRANILKPVWTRVGLGIAKHKDGTYLFVELFSEDPLDMSNLSALRDRVRATINSQRTIALLPHETLDTLAQEWSDKMVREDFFDFNAPDEKSVFDSLDSAKLYSRVGAYLVGNTSFAAALAQIAQNPVLKDSDWSSIGVGIRQDSVGILKITLLYAE